MMNNSSKWLLLSNVLSQLKIQKAKFTMSDDEKDQLIKAMQDLEIDNPKK